MKNETFKLIAWTIGRMAMYFISFVAIICFIAVAVTYMKYGSLVNLWEMPLDAGTTCLGEVLGIYHPHGDLFLLPNQEAVRPDIFVVLFAGAMLGSCILTMEDGMSKLSKHADTDEVYSA